METPSGVGKAKELISWGSEQCTRRGGWAGGSGGAGVGGLRRPSCPLGKCLTLTGRADIFQHFFFYKRRRKTTVGFSPLLDGSQGLMPRAAACIGLSSFRRNQALENPLPSGPLPPPHPHLHPEAGGATRLALSP